MAIPAKLEELILDGKARFETFQCAFTDFSVIPVESKEFIVITGFNFQAPPSVFYTDPNLNVATVNRIEFFDGNNYNHFFSKMGGQSAPTQVDVEQIHNFNDLYLVYKKDCGIAVTIPKQDVVNWSAAGYLQTLDGSNGNAAAKVVNQGTNPYTTTPQTSLARTRGFSAGTDNVPFNRKPNAQNYSSSFNGGPVPGGSTNQFNFTSEENMHFYNTVSNYDAIGPQRLRLGFYLSVHYVRVFETGTNVR